MKPTSAQKRIFLWAASVIALAAAGQLAFVQNAKTQQASERAVAQAAILGRWEVTLPGSVKGLLRLDFPARGAPVCIYKENAVSSAPVSFRILQTPLRARLLDRVQHRAVPPPVYVISIAHGPAANPAGQPWQGHLIGDGNVLILVPASGAPTALRRLGSD